MQALQGFVFLVLLLYPKFLEESLPYSVCLWNIYLMNKYMIDDGI